MRIKVISVGKLKEKYLKQGIAEYAKRLSKYCTLEMIEVPDEKAPESLSQAEMEQIKKKEGERILQKIRDNEQVFILAINGEQLSSEEIAYKMDKLTTQGTSTLTFVIGGSLGLSLEVEQRGNIALSFGRITYPHQLIRLVLVEQIYRSFRIIHGHAYHK